MGWDKLPQEVLLQILRKVRETYFIGLLQCQLTCRTWNKTARILFYSSITIRNSTQANTLINTISLHRLNNFVKNVSFESPLAQSPSIERILPLFFKTCPLITCIDTVNTKDESFWTKLLRECYKGNLSKVQKIPIAYISRDPSIKIHGYVTIELINTLTTVQIWDWPQNDPSFQNSKVAINLPRFIHLEHLIVFVGGVYNAAQIAFLTQGCKKLKFLRINNHPNRRVYYSRNDNDQELPLPNPMTGIKSLDTSMVTITTNFLNQLIHSFPNLNKLKLNPSTEFDFDPESDLDEDLSFIYRMQIEGNRIPTYLWIQFLSHVYKNVDTYELSLLFFSEIEETISNFIQMPIFKNHGLLRLIYVRRSNLTEIRPYVGISSTENNIKVVYETKGSYGLDIDGFDISKLPHMDLLETFGNKIGALQISVSPVIHFGDEDNPLYFNASGYFLDHIFKHCTELTTLMVSSAHLIGCNPDSSISNSITTLRLLECLVCPSILPELSQRLPRLSELVFCYVYFVSPAGQILKTNKNINIEVPCTSIDILSVECTDRRYGDCIEFHLKVSKLHDMDNYYIGTMSKVFDKSTESIHNQSYNDSTSLTIDIYCVSLKTMYLETRNFDMEITFKSNDDFKFKCNKSD